VGEKLEHLAIIMDGNGRWAEQRGLKRKSGHYEGGKAIEKVVKGCLKNNIHYLTLYCFSTENWKRPKAEVDYLMSLFTNEVVKGIPRFNELGARILHLGSREGLKMDTLNALDTAIDRTKTNDRITVQLAINYGGRDEIARAINKALSDGVTHFSPDTLSSYLDNPFVPEPDFICRSAGEKRISGFMLYQCNYAEFGFYDKLWPDWDESMIDLVVDDYNKRVRKFGEIK